jgi:enamine deaminase RidA (YjgF/YER057c/UK114 family)
MKIERHETGPRMSKAVIHGDTVYLAGIVAENPKGKSTAEQTKSILSQIDLPELASRSEAPRCNRRT